MPAGRIRRRWATEARRQQRRLPPSAPTAARPPSKPRLSVIRARRAGHSPPPSALQAQRLA
ncbi:hypothetical protein ACM41_10390 [Bradyrhizobium sp. CCBAU 21362]|nr:hypothetical protein AF336_38530 [Bradyrhizobium diazoefficiens]MDA9536669.1 hypothetical protein [Bradyrhizobium sp. CCBAU 21362]